MPQRPKDWHVKEPPPDADILSYAIWHGQVTPRKLPKNIYRYNSQKLLDGIYKGYKKNPVGIDILSPDFKMLEHLRTNIFMFSAAKTFQQTNELWKVREKLTKELVKGDQITPFNEFKKIVAEVDDQYNKNWLETEYKTAISGGRNASEWQRIKEQVKVFPNLTYHTDEQDTVCEICAPLNGITLPESDPFWDEYYPDNHFNCNCYVTQEDEDADITDEDDVDEATDKTDENMDDMWKRNVGKDGMVFDKEHPYFSVPKSDKEFAKSNFGLPFSEY